MGVGSVDGDGVGTRDGDDVGILVGNPVVGTKSGNPALGVSVQRCPEKVKNWNNCGNQNLK